MQAYFNYVRQLSTGAPVPGATVTVYRRGTLTPATIFADNAETLKDNPFTADANGLFAFYAHAGRYDIQFSGTALIPTPYTHTDIVLAEGQGLHVVNVKDAEFGAKGDGVTDDYAAIMGAYTRLVALGGGILWCPPGVYRHTQALTISHDAVQVWGAGISATVFLLDPGVAAVGWNVGGPDDMGRIRRVVLRDFSIKQAGTRANWGIEAHYIQNLTIERVEVQLMRGGGIHLHDLVFQSKILDCEITQNGTTATSANILLGNACNTNRFVGNRIREAGDADEKGVPVYGYGIHITGSTCLNNLIQNNTFEKHAIAYVATGTGVHEANDFVDNYVEWATTACVHLGDALNTYYGGRVNGNLFDITKATYGVYLAANVEGVAIQGNTFRDEPGHLATAAIFPAAASVRNCIFGPNVVIHTDVPPTPHIPPSSAGIDCLEINRFVRFLGAIQSDADIPAAVTGHVDNWNPSGIERAETLRITSDGAYELRGIVLANGQEVYLLNVSNFVLTIKHEAATSTAANRFWTPGSSDFTIPINGSVKVKKNSSLQRVILQAT